MLSPLAIFTLTLLPSALGNPYLPFPFPASPPTQAAVPSAPTRVFARHNQAVEERSIVRSKRDGSTYQDPSTVGGSMLTLVNNTYPKGLGEPLNVILSAESDSDVLKLSLDNGGFFNYMLSTKLSTECLGNSFGSKQQANLGAGPVDEQGLLRWNFGDPYIGSCKETFSGGLHHRYWQQNSTNAIFMAASVEMDLARQHDIVPNGYNLGRDYVVGNLTGIQVDSRNVTNATTFSGESSFNNFTYETSVSYVSGLLRNSSKGVNHYITVEVDDYPAIDGLVALLTVKITKRAQAAKAESGAQSLELAGVPVWRSVFVVLLGLAFVL